VIDVLAEVVLHVKAGIGTSSGHGRGSGWACIDVNQLNPVDMTLASVKYQSALAHVVEFSCEMGPVCSICLPRGERI
jgi:hypothetical protein